MAAPMQRLADALRKQRPDRTAVELCLVHQPANTGTLPHTVAPGVRALDINENEHASALTAPNLAGVDVVVDFTAPEAAVENMRAVLAPGGRIVVGTTGWYARLAEMKVLALQRGGGEGQRSPRPPADGVVLEGGDVAVGVGLADAAADLVVAVEGLAPGGGDPNLRDQLRPADAELSE